MGLIDLFICLLLLTLKLRENGRVHSEGETSHSEPVGDQPSPKLDMISGGSASPISEKEAQVMFTNDNSALFIV